MSRIWLAGLTGALIVAATSASVSRADFVEYTFEGPLFGFGGEPAPITSAPNIGDPSFSASFTGLGGFNEGILIDGGNLPPMSGQFLYVGGVYPVFIRLSENVYGLSVAFNIFDAPHNPAGSFEAATSGGTVKVAAEPEPEEQGGILNLTGSSPFDTITFVGFNSNGQTVHYGIDNLILYTTPNVPPAPEPSSLVLAGLGIATLGGYTWRAYFTGRARRYAT
jgi:hypothetical protein